MRTPTLHALPTEPLESAFGTARDAALIARDKGIELLESDTAQELLRRGQTAALVARDKGSDLLDSDAAHELLRRGKGVVSAARGDLIAHPTSSRKPVGMMLFVAGAAAGIAAAFVAKRMATTPPTLDSSYNDPAAQFPRKAGIIDLTSVANDEADAEIGSSTSATAGSGDTPTPASPAKSPASPAAKSPTAGSTGSTNGATKR
ncbi:MAG TPA: hypothetical protein VNA12_05200 [Mycobacteriales bacterium]|nr:hypothetical protein [Mycobacteriales bacterium]